jgi:anti-anti-sigma factor
MSHESASGDAGEEPAVDIRSDGPTLVLDGAFDVRSTAEVRRALYEHLDGPDEHVVVDAGGVTAIDLTALRVLAVATRHAWLTGHHLTVRNPSAAVRRAMHLARLAHAIEVERALATA